MASIKPEAVANDWKLDFYVGCALEHISRSGHGNPDQVKEIERAIWYLDRKLKKIDESKKEDK